MTTLVHNGTGTSVEAAESMEGSAASLRRQILEAIRAAGIHGLTRDEIEATTGIPGNTVRPRVWELLAAEAIEEAGEVRRTKTGRAARVLTIRERVRVCIEVDLPVMPKATARIVG